MLWGVYFSQLRFEAQQALSECLALWSTLGMSDFSLVLSAEVCFESSHSINALNFNQVAGELFVSFWVQQEVVMLWNTWGVGEENLAVSMLYLVYLGSLLLKCGTDHACSSASRQLDPFCPVRKDSCTHLFPVSYRHPREASLPFSICDQSCVSREGHRIGQYSRWQQNKSIWVPFPYVAVRLMEALSFCWQMKTRKCPVLLGHKTESQRWSVLNDLQET